MLHFRKTFELFLLDFKGRCFEFLKKSKKVSENVNFLFSSNKQYFASLRSLNLLVDLTTYVNKLLKTCLLGIKNRLKSRPTIYFFFKFRR